MQTRLAADPNGNRPYLVNPSTQQVTEVTSGNYMQPVPAHYHFDYRPELTPGAAASALPAAFDIRIPSFAESVASGDISPRQRDMLFSYELVEDDMTGQVQSIAPIRGEIGSQHTQFIVAGSQSGKTTYMSGIVAQAVAMRTVLYIIDPHKKHPEKSLAARLAALHPWMILPPASTHEEIRRLLDHATRTRDSLIGGETLFDGYHVMFLVDEVPALMAYQRSQEKPIRQLYTDLAVFMQSIGTQTAKFGMTGLFASQFATKEALGEIDFRDSCMSQFIMRLHPTQAQAMRILGKERVNAIPKFPKGHGYLLLSDSIGDPLRVVAGNVTLQDLTVFAGQLPPSPLPFATRAKEEASDAAGASYRQPFTPGEWDFPGRHDARIVDADTPYTDALHGQPANVMPFRKSSAELPVEPTTGVSGERQQQEYLLSDQEITGFLAAYKVSYNIDKALAAVGRGSSRYRPAARRVIAAYGLREEA